MRLGDDVPAPCTLAVCTLGCRLASTRTMPLRTAPRLTFLSASAAVWPATTYAAAASELAVAQVLALLDVLVLDLLDRGLEAAVQEALGDALCALLAQAAAQVGQHDLHPVALVEDLAVDERAGERGDVGQRRLVRLGLAERGLELRQRVASIGSLGRLGIHVLDQAQQRRVRLGGHAAALRVRHLVLDLRTRALPPSAPPQRRTARC